MASLFARHFHLCARRGLSAFNHRTPSIDLLVSRIGTHGQSPVVGAGRIYCSSPAAGEGGKVSARLSQMQQLLRQAEERAASVSDEPTPKITIMLPLTSHEAAALEARTSIKSKRNTRVGFKFDAIHSGDGFSLELSKSYETFHENHIFAQETLVNVILKPVKLVNTKVDMRFNVKAAYWLSDRVRDKILQMEKNRINKDGELVISSTKTRTQKGNIEDALQKLQAIIDAASYVPPPPSEEQKKRIAKLAAVEEQKRQQNKKAHSEKKATRRNKGSWD